MSGKKMIKVKIKSIMKGESKWIIGMPKEESLNE